MKAFLAIFLLVLTANSAFSCSCTNTNSNTKPSEPLKYFDAIFVGKVISIGEIVQHKRKNSKGKYYLSSLTYEVEFEVTRSWKGVEVEKVKIDSEPSSCHTSYAVGQSYFMLAYKLPNYAKLIDANYCARKNISMEIIKNELGEGISFEKPQQIESTESFWSYLWNKIISFFS